MQSVSSLLSMETDLSDAEPGTINDGSMAKKSKQRKRKSFMVDEEGQMGSGEKLAKKILLSLTRPSYVLGLGPKPLRKEHRTRLRYLLRRLVNQHHWVEASGVLSAYIKGTLNETSPFRNRLKFWVLMELLNRVKNNSINPTRIKNLYDIWSKKIGSMKTWPLQSRYAVHFEFIFFCLMQGNAGDAYQLALCIEQNKVDIDPVLKMMMGLTFYELWYSSIPKEFQWRNTDHFDMQENSHIEISFTNKTGQSERYNSVESHMAESHCQRDSDVSIMNDKHISRDVVFSEDIEVGTNKREKTHQNFQPEGFYLNSEEQNGFGDPFSNNGGLTQDILHGLGGIDLWLLPLHFSDESNLEEFMYLQIDQPNDYSKNSVKYLQLALNSEPSASAALLPLVQTSFRVRRIAECSFSL
ncbi:uncharacterized protein HKW66_Vig0241200 [Vigna angularis]|uniref:Uncharacterized protein n=2 Tax=Phaseolus angularis TaxID=3914 RepID=A0A8T0JFQ9_PHAAN|nr:uncharacterized protein HKW66_Vig0241200 [Vigna angularis]BAT92616.1 hypothetical protein VIGAN_07138100 [Vigna angularis var. angularis]